MESVIVVTVQGLANVMYDNDIGDGIESIFAMRNMARQVLSEHIFAVFRQYVYASYISVKEARDKALELITRTGTYCCASIATGEFVTLADGQKYGPDILIAERLLFDAKPGQIILTDDTKAALGMCPK